MSWLLVTQDFPPDFTGGIAAWARDLAEALQGAGEEVTVLARSTGDTRAWDAQQPYRVRRMVGRSWGRFQGVWAGLHGLGRVNGDTRIVAATWPLAVGLLPLARATGARLAVACHGSDLTRLTELPAGLARLGRHAHAFVPVSRFLAGELARLGVPEGARRAVLPMPLPLPPQVPSGPRRGLVLLARLTPLKGVDRAMALADALGEHLTIIGDGPARTSLSTGGKVTLLGRLPRDHAMRHLERARALVLLPRVDEDGTGAEGFGLCVLEAAARGTPAIGCRTGGLPEALGPGLLLEDPDHPDLDAVRSFLADPSQGARARAWVCREHGPHRAVDALREALS